MEKNNEVKNADQLSNSMKKRIERANEIKKAKRQALIQKITWGIAVLLVIAAIGYIVAMAVIKEQSKVTPNSDYSACLDENGYIKGVTASACVTLPQYKGIDIPMSEVEYSDEEMQAAIDTTLAAHKVLETETDLLVEDGSEINLDYVGTIDGVEFEGGNSNGQGSDLTIGSGTFIDDFEQQLIGSAVGDTVIVNVTFPEDYATAELAGQDAEFECIINGIYSVPEYNDDFVKEYLSEHGSTVAEYEKSLKDSHFEENVTNWIRDYLDTNTTVNKYPKKYLKQVKALEKHTAMESFEYINQIYASMYGEGYSDFYEYEQTTEEEYDKNLEETGKEIEKTKLIYQAIAEKEGLKLTIDDYKNTLTNIDDESVKGDFAAYGEPYLIQTIYDEKAIELIRDNANYVD